MTSSRFIGPDGLKNFLNPVNTVTPIVELPTSLNPYHDQNVHIFIKMQSMTPLLNVKMIPAYEMIKSAPAGKKYLVEASSGNTALSLAILGKQNGFSKMKTYVSSTMTSGKVKSLLLFGSDVSVIVEDESNQSSENSGINRAKADGKTADWYNPNQYANEANPSAHADITGPQIYKQLNGRIDVFCSGLGTSGTVLGTARYLRKMKKDITVVGLVRGAGESVPGPRTLEFLKSVELDWHSVGETIVPVTALESYQKSLELCQAGLLVGPSSGFNFAGLLTYLAAAVKHKPRRKRLNAVFVACDTPFPYLDDYFAVLPRASFPSIEGEELLKDKIFKD